MLYEKLATETELAWPLQGMQPRIIRLRRNVTELEQRLTSLEQSVKEEDLVQLAIGLSLKQDNGKPLNKSPKKGSPEGVRGKNSQKETTSVGDHETQLTLSKDSEGTAANQEKGINKSPKRKSNKSSQDRELVSSHIDDTTKTEDSKNTSKDVKEANVEVECKPEILKGQITTNDKKSGDTKALQTSAKDNKKKNPKRREAKEPNKNRRGRNKQKKSERYFIDCSLPASDDILKPADLKSYLLERLKVDGKVKNFGDKVKIELDGHNIVITVTDISFSKRYLKYLTKRFLKKHNLRDWLRIVSLDSSKDSYQIKYYKFSNDASDESSYEE